MKTVIQNARIFSGNGSAKQDLSTAPTCLVIEDGQVTFIGHENDAVASGMSSGDGEVEVVDLQDRIVAPGFIDGHMHLLLFGSSLSKIDLDGCKSLDDIRATIREGAQQRPDAKRLFCQNWMHFMTDSKALASMIDDLDSRPIFITAKDLHSAWCNTAALEEMGVPDMTDPEGGEILRDAAGKPTGLLSEAAAIKIVWPYMAKVTTHEEKLQHVCDAITAYNRAGYTGMIEMATDEESWSLMTELKEKEGLNIRLACHWLITPSKTKEENLAQVERAIELNKQYNLDSSPDLRITGIKVICDGVVDACTAALREPYTSTGTNCDPIWSAEMLGPVVKRADSAGLQCALHAIGDQAVKIAIDAIEKYGTPGRRHRIEHLEVTRPEDSKRLGELGITASVQPVHADPAIFRAWPTLVGPERCGRAFAYQEFLDNNAHLAIGTDAPTAPHLPLANLYTATTRRSAREPELEETVNEHFKLSLVDAMTAASAGSAYSCFADSRVGSLEVGKIADFVVLKMEWVAEKLLEASVEQTWFAGRRVFKV